MDEDGSVDEDDLGLVCSCLVSSGQSVSLIILHVRVWMQRARLLVEASVGTPSQFSHDILIYHGLHLGITIIWTPSRSLCWCIPSGICATDLNFSGRECKGLWHLALALFWRWLCSSKLAFQSHCLGAFYGYCLSAFYSHCLGRIPKKVSDPSLATLVHSTRRWQLSASVPFRRLCFRLGRRMRPRFDSRLSLLTQQFGSPRGSFPRLLG